MNDEFDGLNLVDLIELLEEVPEPSPISMTPQTPGWLVVGLLAVAALLVTVRWAWRRWQTNAYRRAALHALDDAADDPAAIASILRRAALVAYPRSEVASLAGDGWLAFLDSTYPGSAFANGAGRIVATAPYQPQPASPDLHRAARDWLRTHRAPV